MRTCGKCASQTVENSMMLLGVKNGVKKILSVLKHIFRYKIVLHNNYYEDSGATAIAGATIFSTISALLVAVASCSYELTEHSCKYI